MSPDLSITVSLDAASVDALGEALSGHVVKALEAMLPRGGDEWMDSKQAAAYLAISLDALHKLTAARAFPFAQYTRGGRMHFRRSDLDRWREQQMT